MNYGYLWEVVADDPRLIWELVPKSFDDHIPIQSREPKERAHMTRAKHVSAHRERSSVVIQWSRNVHGSGLIEPMVNWFSDI